MSYNLFLDDNRTPKMVFDMTKNQIYNNEIWVTAENYMSFIKTIREFGVPNIISFDHDISDEIRTGKHCAEWLIYYCLYHKVKFPKNIYIHSLNPVGRKNIENLILSYKDELDNL